MRQLLLVLAVGAALACVSPASADTLNYDFSNPTGTLGTSQTYTVDGVTVTARGYSGISSPSSVGTPTNLFGKADGGDENGVGIAAATNHEIQNPYFIQLDLTNVFSKLQVTSEQLSMGSVQSGAPFFETYDIYGSNTLGVPGTKLISAGTLDETLFDIPNFGSYTYITAGTSNPDVLVSGLSIVGTVVPEPGSLALAVFGLGSLAAWLRKSRRAKV
jgi:hypothetical protein